MKINFPALFQTPLHTYKFFFIFGNDPLVFERAISFIQKKFISSLEVKTETDFLRGSISQPSLFNDSSRASLIFVPHVTDKVISQVNSLHDGIFIFTSEKARSTSKLVTYFKESRQGLAIAAYASPLISLEFEMMVEELNLPESFKNQLFTTYQNDYRGLLSTLQKIKLFGSLSEEYWEAFLTPQLFSEDFSSLSAPFLLRDLSRATETLSFLSSSDLISFLRTLIRSFLTLLDLLPYQNNPSSLPWQKITPPVFFKDQPLFQSALLQWKVGEVPSFLETLLYLEHRIKIGGFSLPQVTQALLKQMERTEKKCFT